MTPEISNQLLNTREEARFTNTRPSLAVPKQSIDLLTDRKVSLGLLVNEVSRPPQEVGGEVSCLWVGPNQVTTRYEGKDSQQVAAPTREPATAPTVVPRTVLLDLLPPTA